MVNLLFIEANVEELKRIQNEIIDFNSELHAIVSKGMKKEVPFFQSDVSCSSDEDFEIIEENVNRYEPRYGYLATKAACKILDQLYDTRQSYLTEVTSPFFYHNIDVYQTS